MPPEPAKAWMVSEGDPTAVEGTLSFEDADLRFAPASADLDSVSIPLRDVRKVRRGRAAPVLTLTYGHPEGTRKVFVYFAKPPPLPEELPPARMPIFRPPRGLERSAAALAFSASRRLLKREIVAWERAIRERAEGG